MFYQLAQSWRFFDVTEGKWVRGREIREEGCWEIFTQNCLSESHSLFPVNFKYNSFFRTCNKDIYERCIEPCHSICHSVPYSTISSSQQPFSSGTFQKPYFFLIIPSPKIVINLPMTYEKIYCKVKSDRFRGQRDLMEHTDRNTLLLFKQVLIQSN